MNTREQKSSVMGRGTVFPLGTFTSNQRRGLLGLYPFGGGDAPQAPEPPAPEVSEDLARQPGWVWRDRRRFKAHRTTPYVWKWR